MSDSKTNVSKRSPRSTAGRKRLAAGKRRGRSARASRADGGRTPAIPELVRAARDLLESLPVGAMVLDRNRLVVGFNERLLNDLGLPKEFAIPGETLAALAQRAALQGEPALIALGDTLAQARSTSPGTQAPICEIVTTTDVHLIVRAAAIEGGGFTVTMARRAGPATGERMHMLEDIITHQQGVVFRRIVHSDGRVSMPLVAGDTKQMLGTAPAALMCKNTDILSFADPADRDIIDRNCRDLARKPGPIDFEFSLDIKGLPKKHVRCLGQAFRSENGEIVWDARFTDIENRIQAQMESRRIGALLDSVVENIPHMVSVRNASDLRYVLFNRASEDTLGIERNQVLGKTSREIFFGPAASRRWEHDQEFLKSRQPAEYPEATLDSPNLGRRIIKTRKFPLLDEDGKVRYIMSITDDVTDWRNAQDALEESEKRFRDIAEAASDWFWATDSEMRFVALTMGAAHSESYNASDLKGKTRLQTAAPEDLVEEPEKWARYEDDVKNRRPIRDFIYRVKRVTGGPGVVKVSGNPVFDEDGEFAGYRGAATHITAEVEAEARAAKARMQLVEAVECFNEGFALFDADDRLVMCNRHYLEFWPALEPVAKPGTTYEELIRANAKSGDLPIGYPTLESYINDRVAAHRNAPSTSEQQFRDGRWVEVTHSRTSDGGIVITCSDITGHKEREESLRRTSREALRAKESAEVASRTKSEFLANMSHELRTPLNAVIGFSEIIKDGLMGNPPNENYRNYASDIHDSGRHLLDLINDILDMSKIEAGKLDLAEDTVSIRRAIDSCIVLVRERAENSGILLEVLLPDDIPDIRGDLRKIKQILINLLSNAVKFTETGGSVTIEARIDQEGCAVLSVIDTGIGMKPDEIEKAIEPFGQIDGGLDRTYEGTGLGLTLTKALVELHGGRLVISSRGGEGATGTTVSVVFPPERVIGN